MGSGVVPSLSVPKQPAIGESGAHGSGLRISFLVNRHSPRGSLHLELLDAMVYLLEARGGSGGETPSSGIDVQVNPDVNMSSNRTKLWHALAVDPTTEDDS